MNPDLTIFLASYNGSKFINEQIESIKNQSYKNWKLIASDDASNDATVEILKHFQLQFGSDKFLIKTGPQKGHCQNFLSMTCADIAKTKYYAYCDQDDIWMPDKIERAIKYIDTIPSCVPALYCSRTLCIDEQSKPLHLSSLFNKTPDFKNALVQNIAGGNTMVFNNAARELIKKAGLTNVPAHDWWTYLLVTGCGGEVYYDPVPSILYRQHEENQVGDNSSLSAHILRLKMLLKGNYKDYNNRNIAALQANIDILTAENQRTLNTFAQFRNMGLLRRIYGLQRTGLYRNRFLDNIGLFVATIINKI